MLENHTMVKEKALLLEVPYVREENKTDPTTNLSWVDVLRQERARGFARTNALQDACCTLEQTSEMRSIVIDTS